MLFKSCPGLVKAAGTQDGLAEGQFKALVSVFNNVDSYGDVVMPGAFKDDLERWSESGDVIPIYWSHQMSDPDFNIGGVIPTDAEETKDGLLVVGQLDLEDPLPGSKAPQVYRLLKGRRVTQFSFAYDILEAGWGKRKSPDSDEEREVYELRKLKLHEVGPTPVGANQDTELLAVKSAGEHARRLMHEIKAGRVISSKNEDILREAAASLKTASGHITDVLSQLDAGEDKDGKAKSDGPENAQSPIRLDPAKSAALLEIITAG